jgi:16S rRNA (uracil1498-N3)-methyltransferase
MTKRFFIPDLAKNYLDGTEHHHLKNVMRKKVNESIELFDGLGNYALAHIESIEKNKTFFTLLKTETKAKKTYKTLLFQSLIKKQNCEWIVEKATEIGIDEIVFFPSEFSEIKTLSEAQLKRFDLIVLNAMKQSKRAYFPKVTLSSFEKALKYSPKGYFGSVTDAPHKKVLGKEVSVWIGPEGGFTKKEELLLSKKLTPIKLHENILRAETAAICLSSYLETLASNI